MAKLNPRELAIAARFIKDNPYSQSYSHPLKVAANASWKKIAQNYELGTRCGKQFHFMAKELIELRKTLSGEFGIDPVEMLAFYDSGLSDIERIDAALRFNDEKLAGKRPFADYVQIKQREGPLSPSQMMATGACCDPTAALQCRYDALDLGRFDTLVVVENAASFHHWHQTQSPSELDQALVVYRGHNAMASGCKRLLSRLPERMRVVVFADLDPAGLKIAYDNCRVTHLLIPDDLAVLERLGRYNLFAQQPNDQQSLDRHLKNEPLWLEFWQQLRELGKGLSQEHLQAHRIPLKLLAMGSPEQL